MKKLVLILNKYFKQVFMNYSIFPLELKVNVLYIKLNSLISFNNDFLTFNS